MAPTRPELPKAADPPATTSPAPPATSQAAISGVSGRKARKEPHEYSTNPNTIRVRNRNAKLSAYRLAVERAQSNDLKAVTVAWKERCETESFIMADEATRKQILEDVEKEIMERRRRKKIDARSKITALNERIQPSEEPAAAVAGPSNPDPQSLRPLSTMAPPGYVPFPVKPIADLWDIRNLGPSTEDQVVANSTALLERKKTAQNEPVSSTEDQVVANSTALLEPERATVSEEVVAISTAFLKAKNQAANVNQAADEGMGIGQAPPSSPYMSKADGKRGATWDINEERARHQEEIRALREAMNNMTQEMQQMRALIPQNSPATLHAPTPSSPAPAQSFYDMPPHPQHYHQQMSPYESAYQGYQPTMSQPDSYYHGPNQYGSYASASGHNMAAQPSHLRHEVPQYTLSQPGEGASQSVVGSTADTTYAQVGDNDFDADFENEFEADFDADYGC